MRRFLEFLGAWGIRILLNLIVSTCRVKVRGLEHFISLNSCIVVFWHNRMSLIPNLFYAHTNRWKFTAIVSKSRDGNVLDKMVRSYRGCDTIRVAHNQKEQAVIKMIQTAKEDHSALLLTPDGPKGPIYQAKPGAIITAKEAECPVVAFSWTSSRFWQLNSWDNFRIPKPFSEIYLYLAPPITFSKNSELSDGEELQMLQSALIQADQQAEEALLQKHA